MAVEINPSSELLQIKHSATGKWSPGMTLLRLEEGYDVRLVDEQMQEIEAIASKLANLASLTSVQDIYRSLAAVSQSLTDILSQEKTQTTNVAAFYQAINSAIAQLTQLSQSAGTTNQSIATQLSSLSSAIAALSSSLSSLGSTTSSTTSTPQQQGETSVYETLVTIASAGQIQTVNLPNTTRSLVFSGRKDSLGRSYDIYWSFLSGNLQQGNYKILWAYNEFAKSGLSFKDKVLYLSCGTPITIDVCAYYY